MGKNKKKNRNLAQTTATPAEAATTLTAPPAAVAAATTTSAPPATPKALSARASERTLMDTLPADTGVAQIFTIIGGMLAFPIIVSLVVKLVALPLLFPNW